MEIQIEQTITNEYLDNFDNKILLDLEKYLNESFKDKSYGTSVVKYFFGFELLKFNGGFARFFSGGIASWKTSNKWFVTNAQFDWDVFINLSEFERIQCIKEGFVNSIDNINNLKRKPKDFDYILFKSDLEIVINKFI